MSDSDATLEAKSVAVSPERRSDWWADLTLLGVALIWGVNVPVFKHAIEKVDAFQFNATRLVFSAITLGIVSWLSARRTLKNRLSSKIGQTPSLKEVDDASIEIPQKGTKRSVTGKPIYLFVITFCLTIGLIYQLFFMFGMSQTTSGNAALILASMPMWTAVIAFTFGRERLGKFEWLGLSITLVGTIVIVFQKEGIGFSIVYLIGNLLMLGAALAWSVGTVVSKAIFQRQNLSPIFLAFIACVSTVPIHLIVANIRTPFPREMLEIDLIACLLYSGVLSTGCSYAMWNYGVSKVGASHAAVFQNLIPVFTLVVAYLWKSEIPVLAQYLGGAAIIGGLIIMRKFSSRDERAKLKES